MTGFEGLVLVLLVVIAWLAWKTYQTVNAFKIATIKIIEDEKSAEAKRWDYFYLEAFTNLNDVRTQLEHIGLVVDNIPKVNRDDPNMP